jgi:hypothetical protein
MYMRENVTTETDTKRKNPPSREGATFSPKIKAKIMSKWSKLSESDVDAMNGNFSMLAAKIQDIYSYPKVKAERECEEFKRANKMQ